MKTTAIERRKIIDFLRVLKKNNERTWFKANRALYDEAAEIFNRMAAELINAIAAFDTDVQGIEVKQTTYRIYRDTRFSNDKSPYKTHIGSFINPRGIKSPHLGYYLHIEPDESMIACGGYWLPSDALFAVRNEIVADPQRLLNIMEDSDFQKFYGNTIGFDCLKTIPKGFPKDFPHPALIRPRAYCVSMPLSDDEITNDDWLDRAISACRAAKPFMDYINETVDDYID